MTDSTSQGSLPLVTASVTMLVNASSSPITNMLLIKSARSQNFIGGRSISQLDSTSTVSNASLRLRADVTRKPHGVSPWGFRLLLTRT